MRPVLDPMLLERARRSLRRRDPTLGALIRRVGTCDLSPAGDPYRSLLRSVLYQQLAGAAADAIDRRVRGLFGGRYPRPEVMRDASDAELRAAGLSRQKAAALKQVALAFSDGGLSNRKLRKLDDDAVIEELTQIRGVGEWTAHMVLLFSLGRPDVLPVGDYGVRKGARELYDLPELPGRRELEALGERWRPYRSVAAWYLWRQVDTQTPG